MKSKYLARPRLERMVPAKDNTESLYISHVCFPFRIISCSLMYTSQVRAYGWTKRGVVDELGINNHLCLHT